MRESPPLWGLPEAASALHIAVLALFPCSSQRGADLRTQVGESSGILFGYLFERALGDVVYFLLNKRSLLDYQTQAMNGMISPLLPRRKASFLFSTGRQVLNRRFGQTFCSELSRSGLLPLHWQVLWEGGIDAYLG